MINAAYRTNKATLSIQLGYPKLTRGFKVVKAYQHLENTVRKHLGEGKTPPKREGGVSYINILLDDQSYDRKNPALDGIVGCLTALVRGINKQVQITISYND